MRLARGVALVSAASWLAEVSPDRRDLQKK